RRHRWTGGSKPSSIELQNFARFGWARRDARSKESGRPKEGGRSIGIGNQRRDVLAALRIEHEEAWCVPLKLRDSGVAGSVGIRNCYAHWPERRIIRGLKVDLGRTDEINRGGLVVHHYAHAVEAGGQHPVDDFGVRIPDPRRSG